MLDTGTKKLETETREKYTSIVLLGTEMIIMQWRMCEALRGGGRREDREWGGATEGLCSLLSKECVMEGLRSMLSAESALLYKAQ